MRPERCGRMGDVHPNRANIELVLYARLRRMFLGRQQSGTIFIIVVVRVGGKHRPHPRQRRAIHENLLKCQHHQDTVRNTHSQGRHVHFAGGRWQRVSIPANVVQLDSDKRLVFCALRELGRGVPDVRDGERLIVGTGQNKGRELQLPVGRLPLHKVARGHGGEARKRRLAALDILQDNLGGLGFGADRKGRNALCRYLDTTATVRTNKKTNLMANRYVATASSSALPFPTAAVVSSAGYDPPILCRRTLLKSTYVALLSLRRRLAVDASSV